MEVGPNQTYRPVGRCIYCDADDTDLRKEHIIPLGLGGTLVLPKASCRACEKVTSALERTILRSMLGNFRIRIGLPTRRPDQRPTELPIHLVKPNGQMVRANVDAKTFPLVYLACEFPPPRLLSGLPPIDGEYQHKVTAYMGEDLKSTYLKEDKSGIYVGQVDRLAFWRFLAKVAHSFAVAKLGIDTFRPLLRELILNKPDVPLNSIPQLIGGGPHLPDDEKPGMSILHRLQMRSSNLPDAEYFVTAVRLFGFLGAPSYYVVVGYPAAP